MSTQNDGQTFFEKNKVLVIIGGIVVAVVVLYFAFSFLMHNSVTNAGNKWQQDLVFDLKQADNKLSDCFVKTKQSVGAAQANAGKVNEIVTNAVSGRYDNGGAQVDNGKLFSAVAEAYPDTSNVSNIYKEVLIVINGCRSDFSDAQAKLSADVAGFNTWRTGTWKVRTFGGDNYPTSDLSVKTFGSEGKQVTLIGKEALDKMETLLLTQETSAARGTGTVENTDPFANQ